MKNVWLMTDDEVNRLVEIIKEHTQMVLLAMSPNCDEKRREEIKRHIKYLEKERIEILGR